jgi:SAM-dependent methyltransferase
MEPRMNRFDDLTNVYEAMIDWKKRLGHEEAFYRKAFEEVGARRVLDAACGTGRHAAMFHSWGLDVEGADISPAMIARAKASFGEPEGLRWSIRSFEAAAAPGGFDAVVCVGNSLALVGGKDAVERGIAAMMSAVRIGGVLVVHVLNFWKMEDGRCIWQKCLRVRIAGDEVTVIKGVHRAGDRGFVELLVVDGETRIARAQSVPFLGLEAAELERILRQEGAAEVSVFGGYAGQPYSRGESDDLVIVAKKTGNS